MIVVLKTFEGKKIVCNTQKDEALYKARRDMHFYTRGVDLYTHVSQSGQRYFYICDWSMWEGEPTTCELLSAAEAKDFLLRKMNGDYWSAPEDAEIERAKQLFPDLLNEDA